MATANTPAVKLKTELHSWYEKNLPALNQLWDEGSVKRMYLSAMNAVSRNPELLKCTKQSLTQCMMTSAELHLTPGPLEECAYVPYKDSKTNTVVAQFIPQYQGLSALAIRNGYVDSIRAGVVYENDTFEFEEGSNQYLSHKRELRGRGERIAVWCIVSLKGAGEQITVLGYDDIQGIKSKSRGANSKYSPWNSTAPTEIDSMWKKSAIKQALKTIPKSGGLAKAVEIDNAVERPDLAKPGVIDVDFTHVESETTAELKEAVKKRRGRPKKEEPIAEAAPENSDLAEKPEKPANGKPSTSDEFQRIKDRASRESGQLDMGGEVND